MAGDVQEGRRVYFDPLCLLRDTPEDRERLHTILAGHAASYDLDAILAALRANGSDRGSDGA